MDIKLMQQVNDWIKRYKEEKINYLFDDKELEGVKDNPIKIDEDFLIKISQEIDDYLKENPLEFE